MEAFSDGVLAIINTIMVLEPKLPHGADLATPGQLLPVFLSYVLSFIFVGIYWSNHHHLLYPLRQGDGRILWAKLHLLFGCLSSPSSPAGWARTTSRLGPSPFTGRYCYSPR